MSHLRARSVSAISMGVVLLIGSWTGAHAATPQATPQTMTQASPTAVLPKAGAVRDSRTTATLRLSRLPRNRQRVVVDIRTRQSGKARYVTRLIVKRSGKVRLKYVRVSSTGKSRKLGRTRTMSTRLAPKVSYTVEATTADRPARVTLRTRLWRSTTTPPRWYTRNDRSRARLSAPGSTSTRTRSSAKAPKAKLVVITSGEISAPPPSNPTTSSGDEAEAGAQPSPSPSAPPAPARAVGSPGTGASLPGLKLPPADLGGVLPSTRKLSSAQRVFVAPSGSDQAGGTAAAPVRTLPRALDLVSPGGQVVMRGGTYPVGPNAATVYRGKPRVTITNYPGERPVLDGSVALSPSRRNEGSGVVSASYTQVPAGLGEGVNLNWLPAATFSGGQPTGRAASIGWECVASNGRGHTVPAPTSGNPDGCPAGTRARVVSGYYPDQVWAAGVRLTQVLSRNRVRPGFFYVKRSASNDDRPVATRIYLAATDVDKGPMRVSAPATRSFIQVDASDVTISGLEIRRFSSSWNNYAVHVYRTGQRITLRDMQIVDTSGVAIKAAGWKTPGGGDILNGVTLNRVRILRPGWKGLTSYYVTGLTLTGVQVDGSNAMGEWPLSSALHVTHTHNTTMRGSVIKNSTGRGAWFDQSSYNTRLVSNRFEGNDDHQVFYEFSHALTMIGNLLVGGSTDATLRLSGASDTKLANNTIVGGKDSIWAYVDSRAKSYYDTVHKQTRWCAEHRVRYGESGNAAADCNVTFVSDFDTARLGAYSATNRTPGLNWRVSITTMVNNIVGPAKKAGHCVVAVPVCITGYTEFDNKRNEIPMRKILPASAKIDGNVYQTAGQLLQLWGGPDRPGFTRPKTVLALQSSLSDSYYQMTKPEWHAQSGTGWTTASGAPKAKVVAKHGYAAPSPNQARLTPWLPSGSRHYGAFWG